MSQTEKEYIDDLVSHASETRALFSNLNKSERERMVCRAFLRLIGVQYQEAEFENAREEPVDVPFRDAHFQIRELLDPGRKRSDEWKEREKEYTDTTRLIDLSTPYHAPTPVTIGELVPLLTDALSDKAQRYGAECANVDALVYVNLRNQFFAKGGKASPLRHLKAQGWRSVSIVFLPYAQVLFASPAAPQFLKDVDDCPLMKWSDLGSVFDEI